MYLHSLNETKKIGNICTKLPNQHRNGGQSAQRFGRIRDEMINVYVKKIVELLIKHYVVDGVCAFNGIVISGPAGIKEDVKNLDMFKQYFSEYVVKTITTPEICDNTINFVISQCQDVFCKKCDESEMEEVLYDPVKFERLVFGEENVMKEYVLGNLKEIYVGEEYHEQNDGVFRKNVKTKINVIHTVSFVSKYGNVVGVKYY